MSLQRPRSGAGNETLLFLHLGKTAGSTLASIIRRQYPEDRIYRVYDRPAMAAVDRFAELSEDERARYRAIIGHMHLGMHKLVPGPSTYITLLREPVRRAISTYYFVLANPKHLAHDEITRSGLSFAEVLESGLLPILDNSQTKVFCTTEVPDIPYGGCRREMLEEAKHNLDRRFAIFGLTERFDESLLMMKDRFSWKNVLYKRRNVTRGGPRHEDLTAEVLELIRAHNRLDLELYAYARARFEEQVSSLGPRFERRVKVFRMANDAMNRYPRVRKRVRG